MSTIAITQIELNKKYGKRLVIIAWAIEIVAASIGLFIGIQSAYFSIGYYEKQFEQGTLYGDTFTNAFIGAAPFIIIAAVELTKIPLALGFYRTKRLLWRTLFLFTLFLLIFVTFETIFNGLERWFSASEDFVQEPRRELLDKRTQIINIDQRLGEISARTIEAIEDDFSLKRQTLTTKRIEGLSNIREARDQELTLIQGERAEITEQLGDISEASGVQNEVNRLEDKITELTDNLLINKEDENKRVNDRLNIIEVQLSNINKQEVEEINSKGFFTSRDAIKSSWDKQREPLEKEKFQLISDLKDKTGRLETNYQSDKEKLNSDLELALKSLGIAQARASGTLESSFERLNDQQKYVMGEFLKREEEINKDFLQRFKDLEEEKENLKRIQTNREIMIPDLENQRTKFRQEAVTLEGKINAAARGNNIYRITQLIYGLDNAADIKNEQVRTVAYTWFGSIAFIAASVGAIIALAGFILQDPESYKPLKIRKNPIKYSVRRLLILMRRTYKKRKSGLIRGALRRMMVDIRRRVREPKIKIQKVEVSTVIEKTKEVEVLGPEKVVYKEVPKEIIRKELVYVPIYSVEDGTLKTSSAKIIESENKDE